MDQTSASHRPIGLGLYINDSKNLTAIGIVDSLSFKPQTVFTLGNILLGSGMKFALAYCQSINLVGLYLM